MFKTVIKTEMYTWPTSDGHVPWTVRDSGTLTVICF